MSFVSGNNFVTISLAIVAKNLLKAADIVLGLVSVWLFMFRDIIYLFDLIFTLVRDLTISQVCLEFFFCSLKNVL